MKSLFIAIFAMMSLNIYGQEQPISTSTQVHTSKMKLTGDKEIDDQIIHLTKSMKNYMEEENPSYTQNDIDSCASILVDYTVNIYKTQSKQEGMETVKSAVLKLNALNDKCKGSLIETGEREQIAEIIILASHKMKYNSMDEDITEEWREW